MMAELPPPIHAVEISSPRDYGIVMGQAVASYRGNQKNGVYLGASAERFSIDQSSLKSGRFYTAAEDSGGAQVVILGNKIASDLFKQDEPLGKILRIGSLNFVVIGVYNPSRAGTM